MNFKGPFNYQPTFASFITMIEKSFTFFSFIYQLKTDNLY